MKRLKTEKDLLLTLYIDVDDSMKDIIVFLGGHFPLLYSDDGATEALNQWGEFSKYSLELSCKVAQYARSIGKIVRFVFFVDDHMYEDSTDLSSAKRSTRRNKLYKLRSGVDATLPKSYLKIMSSYGFSEKDVIRQNQKKLGREDCLYFSEKNFARFQCIN